MSDILDQARAVVNTIPDAAPESAADWADLVDNLMDDIARAQGRQEALAAQVEGYRLLLARERQQRAELRDRLDRKTQIIARQDAQLARLRAGQEVTR